jgi:hypothetical protein
MQATKSYYSLFNDKKTTWLLGVFVWIIGFFLSFIIMALLNIHPEIPSEKWGVYHPKYLEFEFFMISSMIVLMFIVVKVFYASKVVLSSKNDVLIDGSIVMLVQFILDFLMFTILFGVGISYFLALVTISYLTIPIQFYFFVQINFPYNY